MATNKAQKRSSALEPIGHVPVVVFGVLMATSFTRTLSVAAASQESEP